MTAYYDSYDYSSYWGGREYEHESEVIALRSFLSRISQVERSLEIGGGFGRLVPYYAFRVKRALLTDPSAKLLGEAKKGLSNLKNVEYQQSTLENLYEKTRPKKFDLVLMIRVMHHLTNPGKSFAEIEKVTADGGYFILEFANKIHFKNVISELLKGNFRFWSNEETIDVRSEKSKKQKTIAFLNYHPNVIRRELKNNGFEIIQVLSVSNIRSPFLKKHLPKNILLELEGIIQKLLSYIYFGPSIFVLAKKRG